MDLERTIDAIAAVQLGSGLIPHTPGGEADPWNHVEAAMALDVGGRHAEALAAYRYLAQAQRPDGSLPSAWRKDGSREETVDANFVAYLAVGVRHHLAVTGDLAAVEELWPAVERALDLVVDLQLPGGGIAWARDPAGQVWDEPLLTSSACIHLALGCGLELAVAMDRLPEKWFAAYTRLGRAVREGEGFLDRARYSMDWYYPVLTGSIEGDEAHRRIAAQWSEFVVTGTGVRCVSDEPWITAGETAELVLALTRIGSFERARHVFEWLQHLRADDGAYWMGATFPDGTVWPREKPTWGTGAVVLAYDALHELTGGARLFRERPAARDEARAS